MGRDEAQRYIRQSCAISWVQSCDNDRSMSIHLLVHIWTPHILSMTTRYIRYVGYLKFGTPGIDGLRKLVFPINMVSYLKVSHINLPKLHKVLEYPIISHDVIWPRDITWDHHSIPIKTACQKAPSLQDESLLPALCAGNLWCQYQHGGGHLRRDAYGLFYRPSWSPGSQLGMFETVGGCLWPKGCPAVDVGPGKKPGCVRKWKANTGYIPWKMRSMIRENHAGIFIPYVSKHCLRRHLTP